MSDFRACLESLLRRARARLRAGVEAVVAMADDPRSPAVVEVTPDGVAPVTCTVPAEELLLLVSHYAATAPASALPRVDQRALERYGAELRAAMWPVVQNAMRCSSASLEDILTAFYPSLPEWFRAETTRQWNEPRN